MVKDRRIFAFVLAIMLVMMVAAVRAQVDDICAEVGVMPSLDSPFAHVPYVFGRVTLRGFDSGLKPPKVTVIFSDGQQGVRRWMLGKSGNYCFRRGGGSGLLVVEVDGIEVGRRTLPSFGAAQQREDFEVLASGDKRSAPPAAFSAKLSHPPNPKTAELYIKAADAERVRDIGRAIAHLKEIVSIDPSDFIAWAKLGSLLLELKSFTEADAAFRRSLELKVEYTPAWINVGKLRMAQNQYEAAIEIFKHAASLEPTSARIYQLLGEAYLQGRKGTLGAEALNKSIELDPIGMAECHLQLAHLYQLAGAKALAAREYRLFLGKVPDHPDKKKFEKYIKDNAP